MGKTPVKEKIFKPWTAIDKSFKTYGCKRFQSISEGCLLLEQAR